MFRKSISPKNASPQIKPPEGMESIRTDRLGDVFDPPSALREPDSEQPNTLNKHFY
jgi:hypothetical protein